MNADDPRHGSIAGYNVHRRSGVPVCDACRTAKRNYEKRRLVYSHRKVSSLGAQRRIQALRVIGYSLQEMADAGGWTYDHGAFKYPLAAATITYSTHARIAALYDRLSTTPSTGPKASRCRAVAASKGWLPPAAWDDIDDPDERPLSTRERGNYAAAELVAEWDHLRRAGESIERAASRLGVGVEAIEKAVERVSKKEVA